MSGGSLTFRQGLVVRGEGRWQNLEAWFDAMESRPTYLATRSDHYTHVHDLPPQLGGAAADTKLNQSHDEARRVGLTGPNARLCVSARL